MVHQNEACEKCTGTCLLLLHGQRNPSPTVSSFFKPMIDKRFSKVLFFPPQFARLVSHLIDQETYLEDSIGQRWRVTICEYKGSLAIKQGWDTFSSEHGLKIGDFLVFHFIHGQHFVVQIFGTSGCQKLSFCSDTCKGKKRARTNGTLTSEDEVLPESDPNLRKKRNSNIDADTGQRQRVPQEGTSDIPQDENGHPNHISTDLGSQLKSSSVYEVPVETEFLTSEVPWNLLDVGITQTDDFGITQADENSEAVNNNSPLGLKDKNGHPMGLTDSTSVKSTENGSNGSDSLLQSDNTESLCVGSNIVIGENSNGASEPEKDVRVDKRELNEKAAKAHCPGKAPRITKEAEPADSEDSLFPGSFSCSLQMDGRNFLELPQRWPNLVRRKNHVSTVIHLQGPDNRSWPVIFRERSGVKALTGGWASFTAVFGLEPGDECVFQLLDPSECIFTVHKEPPS